ncbi:hypothetical protein [Streptomyces sp. AK02-01A]|uniref:hypothetical protein n=1 Tax=Streptomyces sp. AK02-01A TaxID=3028648 RepID=UPI0029A37261|nr:hypothetical protein [Streptomyces sp. AK02-01A]MDX3851759.1 hypothetical protein [Streptomyces sp. AK02-01A]
MARLIPLIVAAIGVYLWLKSRRSAASVVTAGPPALSDHAVRLGFLPAERLDTDHAAPPAPGLERALAGARDGDWAQAADLLAEAGQDWERRSMYAYSLGDAAAKEDGWLLAWEDARPDDPDAAVVRARSTVILAWKLRGAAGAKNTSDEQFDAFHRTLARSREDIARAATLNPEDPTPYITEMATAAGFGYPHEEMHRLWAEASARAPLHYEAHFVALQYWCAKWRGSDELARAFAARAAADAPPGSLMSAFPLIAWFEEHLDETVKKSVYRGAELTALVNAALVDAAAAPEDHPRLAELRHLLAYFLYKQGRYDAALEQFRLVDGYVDALPWRYYPTRLYVTTREATVRKAG